MRQLLKTGLHTCRAGLIALLATALPYAAQAEEAASEAAPVERDGRIMAMQAEAEVISTNLETRQVRLKGADGQEFSITAPEEAGDISDIEPGDHLVVKYIEALESELRAPTEEEIAEPWVELGESGIVGGEGQPEALAGARVIRAVVTIEGMNRALGAVTIKDSRGMLHVIGGVEPEKMEGVSLGDTAVMIYTEAVAISLTKKADLPATE